MRVVLVSFLLVSLALAGCATPASDPTPAPRDDGNVAPGETPPTGDASKGPAWSFSDTDGAEHSRDAPDGEATVMFFMATWCSSCRGKAPLLRDIHADYADKGVRFYSLDFDPTESRDDIEGWKRQYGQDWPHAIDHGRTLQQTFGVTSQSTVVLLDENGNLVKRWGYGQVNGDQLRSALDETLA